MKRLNNLYQFDLAYKTKNLIIAGVDEAGRGPLAGPVVSAAVILDFEHPIPEIDDSKRCSANKRKILFEEINKFSLAIGIGIVDHNIIDEINILNATKKAMFIALKKLKIVPDKVLIDAVQLKGLSYPVYSIIKGDTLSASIAAASIIAKVTRDSIMEDFHIKYPDYQFASHKGYPTKKHLEILNKLGPTTIHRKTFAPVKKFFQKTLMR